MQAGRTSAGARAGGPRVAIRIDGVSVRRSGAMVIEDLTLDVQDGVTVVLGPNGAGKSTLFGALVGLIPLRSGTVSFGTSVGAARPRIGFVPQDVELPTGVRLSRAVDYAAWLHRIPAAQRDHAVQGAIAAVRLEARAGERTGRLSGGMRRRVQVAMAIVHDPELLVLDEPSVGLDPQEQAVFRDVVRALGADRPVVLSTHVLDEAATVADRLVVLADGVLAFDGTPEELLSRAGTAAGQDRTRALEQAYVAVLERTST